MNLKPKIYIVLVNYNRWQDTIECIKSLLGLNSDKFRIIIVDNFSENDSVINITNWLERESVSLNSTNNLSASGYQIKIWSNGLTFCNERYQGDDPLIWLIKSEKNLGFSGGNNLGIKIAIRDPECKYVWLLNNDTIVDKNALDLLVNHCEKNYKVGVCGSCVRFFDYPRDVQAYGGIIRLYYGKNEEIKSLAKIKNIDYVIGTSMLISRNCIMKTGFLPEELFLYFEEAYYCANAKKAGFSVEVVPKSYVYHKDGISSTQLTKEFYYCRNLLYFFKQYHSFHLIFAFRYLLTHRLFLYLIQFKLKNAFILIKAVIHFFLGRKGQMPVVIKLL